MSGLTVIEQIDVFAVTLIDAARAPLVALHPGHRRLVLESMLRGHARLALEYEPPKRVIELLRELANTIEEGDEQGGFA